MQKLIQNLRQRPEEERKHILHILTAMFAVILVVLWAYSLGNRISNPDLSKEVKEDLQPFSRLTDDLGDSFNTISPENQQGNTSNLEFNQ